MPRSMTASGRARMVIAMVVGVCAGAAVLAGPVAADPPGEWMEYRSADFAVPAGARCPFALTGTVIEDAERIRTLDTYPDGAPRTQEVAGELVVRYANADTGRSVDRNLTGTALLDVRPDGSLHRITLVGGHFAAGLRAGDAGGPAFLVFTGSGYAVTFEDDGTRSVTDGHGGVENLCVTLA